MKFETDDEEELLLLRTSVDRLWKQRTRDAERRSRQGRAVDAARNSKDAHGLGRIRTRINRALRAVQKGGN